MQSWNAPNQYGIEFKHMIFRFSKQKQFESLLENKKIFVLHIQPTSQTYNNQFLT